MFVRIGSLGNEAVSLSAKALVEFLRGGNVTATGEPKEEIEVFHGGFVFGMKELEAGDGGIPWSMSTFDLDRFDERIDPAGWELANYLQNPVVQWAHDHEIPAIGRAVDVAVHEGVLEGRVIFNDRDYDEFGWSVGERVRRKIIRAGSVGFLLLKVELPDKRKEPEAPSLIYRKQELLEFSACNVPANPFALAGDGMSAGGEGALRSVFRVMGRLEKEIENVKFRLFEEELLDEARSGGSGSEGIWRNMFRGDSEGERN